jgi:hypothetical protein
LSASTPTRLWASSMASRIEEIEAILVGLIESAEGEPLTGTTPVTFAEVLDVEIPPTVFPASTLLFSYPSQTFIDLGANLSENEWRWVQRSYFDATGDELLAEAQREMKRLLPALQAVIRRVDPDDLYLEDGTFVQLDIEDAGDPNVTQFSEGGPRILVKALNLVARTEEN